MSWLPMVWNADSELIGSWNTRPISPPRIARICAPSDGSLHQVHHAAVRAAQHDLAADDAAGPFDDAQDGPRGHAFAAARFADDAQRLAREQIERGAVHRAHHAFVGEEMRLQVAHGQDRLSHTDPPRRAGRRPGS